MIIDAFKARIAGLLSRLHGKAAAPDMSSTSYWTRHNVTLHHDFGNAEDSLRYFHWRNAQYFGYLERMPVSGYDGKVVLDYGCGPGHDLVGFGSFSKPSRLIGIDVSATSLSEAGKRLALHGIKSELIQIEESTNRIPLPDACIDHVHSSGVLHHVPDPLQVLREMRRLLRPGGTARIMVYNYDSLWLHLYTAYLIQLVGERYPGLDIRTAFSKTTDGEDCPISRVYTPDEFLSLAREAGFAGTYTGGAVAVFEASLLPQRFPAIMDRRLPAQHRDFLCELRLDAQGLPLYRGQHAGVDGCYLLQVH